MALVSGVALIALYVMSLPAVVDYVTFMKVREDGLSEDQVRLAVLDLRRLRRRHHRPLHLARLAGPAGRRPGRVRSHQGELRRMNLDKPVLAVARRDHRPRLSRAADRPRDDRRLDPLPAARRAGHGNRRRAAAQRHVLQLRHPRGAAVHPGRRVHEHRQHDRSPHDASATPWSAASAAASPRSTSLQSIIFAGMSGSAIADAAGTGTHDAGHDDPRRTVYGEATPRR